mgnify:CR=1 FL=1
MQLLTGKNCLLQDPSHGPLDLQRCSVVNVLTQRCYCPFFIFSGHACPCLYAYEAFSNLEMLQRLDSPSEQLRVLFHHVRGKLPCTKAEADELGYTYFCRKLGSEPSKVQRQWRGPLQKAMNVKRATPADLEAAGFCGPFTEPMSVEAVAALPRESSNSTPLLKLLHDPANPPMLHKASGGRGAQRHAHGYRGRQSSGQNAAAIVAPEVDTLDPYAPKEAAPEANNKVGYGGRSVINTKIRRMSTLAALTSSREFAVKKMGGASRDVEAAPLEEARSPARPAGASDDMVDDGLLLEMEETPLRTAQPAADVAMPGSATSFESIVIVPQHLHLRCCAVCAKADFSSKEELDQHIKQSHPDHLVKMRRRKKKKQKVSNK